MDITRESLQEDWHETEENMHNAADMVANRAHRIEESAGDSLHNEADKVKQAMKHHKEDMDNSGEVDR